MHELFYKIDNLLAHPEVLELLSLLVVQWAPNK